MGVLALSACLVLFITDDTAKTALIEPRQDQAVGEVTLIGGVRSVGMSQETATSSSTAPPSGPRVTGDAIPVKIVRYCQRLIHDCDWDGDGHLDRQEWGSMRGFLMADSNRDGLVELNEVIQRVVNYGRHRRIRLSPPLPEREAMGPLLIPTTAPDNGTPADGQTSVEAINDATGEADSLEAKPGLEQRRRELKFFVPAARLPSGLPSSFLSRDANGDGQLTMVEFAPQATASNLSEFSSRDLDGDGVITAKEYLRTGKATAEK